MITHFTLLDVGAEELLVSEIYVSVGDQVKEGDNIVLLESDKTSVEVPINITGCIDSINVKVGDKVNTGDVICDIITSNNSVSVDVALSDKQQSSAVTSDVTNDDIEVNSVQETLQSQHSDYDVYASPSIRKYARTNNINLASTIGTGKNGRILMEDIIDNKNSIIALTKVNKSAMGHLVDSWTSIPHVTHFDEANIDSIENFRKLLNRKYADDGIKFTLLAFIIKAVQYILQGFSRFNSRLDDGKVICYEYYNIAFAVDTLDGLVAPVIKNVQNKLIMDIVKEVHHLAQKARDNKLAPTDLQGGTFTISSLGGIGGTGFTPIINSPQVAILGVSRSYVKAVYNGDNFSPQLTLPLSLSYDHRVIDGALAARFMVKLTRVLSDIRYMLI